MQLNELFMWLLEETNELQLGSPRNVIGGSARVLLEHQIFPTKAFTVCKVKERTE